MIAKNELSLAEIVGRTDRTIRNWVDDGCPRNDDGSFSVAAVIEWLVDRNSGKQSAMEQKIRLTRAQAEKAELDAARLRSELVPVLEVQRVWNKMLGAFRAKVLALPAKIAPMTASAKGKASEHRRILDDATRELLSELSGLDPDEIRDDENLSGAESVNPAAAAPINGKRVGGRAKKAQSGVKRRAGAVAH